eukprot:TRINITY_DN3685_c0_g2_i1.p1 TRINITY_DN3685_c0_g2~~TRINITY_DN3685_c0_g2_i1.p1  ORF type:complete len:218 (-),score=41.68 TRINITY_DN3685_c0_g2_i1:33-686(-)
MNQAGFIRYHGYNPISAADTIYCLSSLLGKTTQSNESIISNEYLMNNFFDAYDFLTNCSKGNIFEIAINEAIDLQKAIVRQMVSMFERKEITSAGPFRYALISHTHDLKRFLHPITLSKLAQFIVDTIIESGRRRNRPFILGALKESTDTYLVAGVPGYHSGSARKTSHNLGNSVQQAARSTHSTLSYHSFDSSVVEVQQEHITRFMEYLGSGLVSF